MNRLLVLLCAVLCIAAVCTPQQARELLTQGTDVVLEEQTGIDYALIIDRSGSMEQGDRFLEATSAARSFVEQLRGNDRAGIIGFDRRSTTYSGLSGDTDSLIAAINRMRIGDFTQYNQGLSAASALFAADESSAHRVAVMLSDGKPDDDSQVLSDAVDELLGHETCIFTIAYADAADEQAQQELRSIAQRSQEVLGCGGYFRAQEDSYDLRRIYNEIFDLTTDSSVFSVRSQVSGLRSPLLEVDVRSRFTNVSVLSQGCFSPEITAVILRDNQVVDEQILEDSSLALSLPAGEYSYVVRAVERCGGECSYTGEDEGSFRIDTSQAACVVRYDQLAALVSTSDSRIVEITGSGFSPQTIGTDGIVTWRNVDESAHQISGLDGSFSSPVLRPGDEWSYAFAPGEYAFVDTQSSLTGAVRSQRDEQPSSADVILVLDQSGSMAGSPLASAKSAANTLLDILSTQDRASLIVFSDRARLIQALTGDISLLRAGIRSVHSEGSTSYVDALDRVGEQLAGTREGREQLVIFLSDGAPSESSQEVVDAVRQNIGSACLYTIGYGEQGQEAIGLLSRMADVVQERNECGLFYYSQASERDLSRVFGEVYALSTNQGLEFVNLSVDGSVGSVSVSTQVRSRSSERMVPFSEGSLCLPVADVELVLGSSRFPLVFDGERYVVDVELAPGTYTGSVTARIAASDDPARIVVGSVPVSVRVRSPWVYSWLVIGAVLLVAAGVKLFMRRRSPPEYAY